jgi:hypothetical protein
MSAPQLANTLRRAISFEYQGKAFEAEQLYRQLTSRRPVLDMAHFMYAQFLLRKRRYDEAWPHFMSRLNDEVYQAKPLAQLDASSWDALEQDGIADQTLLIGCDQGIGDALMCARYIPEVANRFRTVIFMVFKGFRELFSSLERFQNVFIIEFEETIPEFDLYIDVFSLPAIFNTLPATIPGANWMDANPEKAEAWRGKLDHGRINVGFAWQGNSLHSRDGERSVPLSGFLPLLQVDVNSISLQVGDGHDQIDTLPDNVPLKVYSEITSQIDLQHGKMLESAALISSLDLVVAVDTAVAHLAGALGTPCWLVLPLVPDWRWMEDVAFSDWYLTTRLFRPNERYDFKVPIAQMEARLIAYLNSKDVVRLP